ncbi:hypothetical protein TNCV_3978161 [Trichonephila clavipes]|nr:hypothetical protein TNCV_3978161 [Trichonephila clavipes]
MIARRKDQIPDEIANLLRVISEDESDSAELPCSNLESDEDIRLRETDCEESEESADIIDNIPCRFWSFKSSEFDPNGKKRKGRPVTLEDAELESLLD